MVTSIGAGVLIGPAALAVLLPLALLALLWSFRRHRQPAPLAPGALALAIGYAHILGGTPEWSMALVVAASLTAAGLDWRASTQPAQPARPASSMA